MKKTFALLTAVLMLVLTACTGGTAPAEGDSNTTGEGITVVTESGGTVKNSFASFTCTDIEGNTVNQDIFKGYKLTMINIWATFCSPCIEEMPDIAELNREYTDKGFRVIGIISDAVDFKGDISDSILSEAHDIIDETGADYIHLLPSADLNTIVLNDAQYVPETVFVDENGNIIGESYIGSRSKAEWKIIINKLLK